MNLISFRIIFQTEANEFDGHLNAVFTCAGQFCGDIVSQVERPLYYHG